MPLQLAPAVLLTVSLTVPVADGRVESGTLFSASGETGATRSQAGRKALSVDSLRLKDAYRAAKSEAPSPSGKGGGSRKALPWTRLMQAAAHGDHKALRRVLSKGANPNARSSNGWTPLRWAVEQGHFGVAKLLLDQGALRHEDKDAW